MSKHKWSNILSNKRVKEYKFRRETYDVRTDFEDDYERILFSASFRRLQDKAQVFALEQEDFVRTRLTHSFEVSAIAKSLGRSIGDILIEKTKEYDEKVNLQMVNDICTVLSCAGLIHDLGNPPFGHSGEKAIGDFFSRGKGLVYKESLTDKEWQDLIEFEGNANGFSLLTKSRPGIEGGLRISYATLGAFMKYPKESLPKKPTRDVCDKKYGFFQSDKEAFIDVASELGLLMKDRLETGFHRHPLAYLVEAADDICYTIIDFEDGINLGWIPEEHALEFLIKIVQNSINSQKYAQLTSKEDRVSYLRALAIGSLINEVTRVFVENEERILAGDFPFALTEKCAFVAQMKDVISVSINNVYQSKEVIEKEVVGYQVIHTLLEHFCTAYNNHYYGEETHYDSLILRLLPEKYRGESDSVYERLMNICHFVSMLTDGKALELYRAIKVSA